MNFDKPISYVQCLDGVEILFWAGGWLEKWGLKLTSAKNEVEVEAELLLKCDCLTQSNP